MTQVACYRNPEFDMWWYNEVSDWWLFLLVPIFAASLGIWFRADWRSRDMVVMVFVGCAGYAVSFFLDTVSTLFPFRLALLMNSNWINQMLLRQ